MYNVTQSVVPNFISSQKNFFPFSCQSFIMFGDQQYLEAFNEMYASIKKHMRKGLVPSIYQVITCKYWIHVIMSSFTTVL